MNVNMKNFRKSSDSILKDIYVTDELKRRTLEKCTDRRSLKPKASLAAVFSVVLMVSLGTLIYYFNITAVTDKNVAKSIDQKYKNSSKDETKSSNNLNKPHYSVSNNEDNKHIQENKNAAVKDSNNTIQNKNIAKTEKKANTVPQSKKDPQNITDASESNDKIGTEPRVSSSLASSAEPFTIEKAEKYFESKILLPSYIPEGFKLTDISVPDDKIKCIRLEYTSGSAYFEILQSKDLSESGGTSSISIGDNTAYITSVKDEKANIVTTKITWIMDNIQYSLSSSLPEDSVIKIAESIH